MTIRHALASLAAVALALTACTSESGPVSESPATAASTVEGAPATGASTVEGAPATDAAGEVEAASADTETDPEPATIATEAPAPTDAERGELLVVPPGAEVVVLVSQAAQQDPAAEVKKSCTRGGPTGVITDADGTTVTVTSRTPEGSVRTIVSQCKDGKWVTISDTTSDPPSELVDEPDDTGGLQDVSVLTIAEEPAVVAP